MNTAAGLSAEDFDTLDQILDDLRSRHDETPQWEFCEGFLAALVCCRRPLQAEEWLPVLLGLDEGASFAGDAQRAQFLALWQRREDEVRAALDTTVEALDDDRAYAPEVLDVRGAIATLSEEEQREVEGEDLPETAEFHVDPSLVVKASKVCSHVALHPKAMILTGDDEAFTHVIAHCAA